MSTRDNVPPPADWSPTPRPCELDRTEDLTLSPLIVLGEN